MFSAGRIGSYSAGRFYVEITGILVPKDVEVRWVSMHTIPAPSPEAIAECKRILLEIGFPAHRAGYKQLKCGIPRFAMDDQQSLTGELYPYIAETLGYTDERAVERSIRRAILYVWQHGNRDAWEKYFPGCRNVPSNKRFIATIAEYL